MTDLGTSASAGSAAARLRAAAAPGARADAWQALSEALAREGCRAQGLVAARTALALRERTDATGGDAEASRRTVRDLTGPDVVPLHVDVPVGEHDTGPDSRDHARAVWAGAPAEPVLAMIGWVEREGALDVVRVVVPGTGRGRSAFGLLVDALPTLVPASVRLPARDPGARRLCERAGFSVVEGSSSARGHVGGSLRLHRPAAPTDGVRGRA